MDLLEGEGILRGTILTGVMDTDDATPFSMMRHVRLKDLLIMSTVSNDIKRVVDDFLVHSWEQVLGRFVPNPAGFRAIIRANRAVISGSLALWYLCGQESRTGWLPGDCDIYTPIGQAESMSHFLREHADYAIDTSRNRFKRSEGQAHLYDDNSDPRDNPSINSVEHLCNSHGNKIDIIESASDSALEPLPRFWSSLLANYISADSFCIPFPCLTLHSQGLLTIADGAPVIPVHRAMEKYKDRGYDVTEFADTILAIIHQLYPTISQDCSHNPYCPHTKRQFGDRWCLQYDFDGKNAEEWPIDAITVQWKYGGSPCGKCGRSSAFECCVLDKRNANSKLCLDVILSCAWWLTLNSQVHKFILRLCIVVEGFAGHAVAAVQKWSGLGYAVTANR